MINSKIYPVKFYKSYVILAIFTICINVLSAFCNFWTVKANPFFLVRVISHFGSYAPLQKSGNNLFSRISQKELESEA